MRDQLLPRGGVLVYHSATPGRQVRFVDAEQDSLLLQGDYGGGQICDLSRQGVKACFLLSQSIEIACWQASLPRSLLRKASLTKRARGIRRLCAEWANPSVNRIASSRV